jgi:hypothetical protein
MKINFKIKAGGQTGSSESVGETIDRVGVEQIRKQMTKKLEGLRCSEHDQVPQLEITGAGLKDLKISIRACCDKMRAQAARALN